MAGTPRNKVASPLPGAGRAAIQSLESAVLVTQACKDRRLVERVSRRSSGDQFPGDNWAADRPDIGNPTAPLGSRAVIWTTTGAQACQSGYRNPDSNTCISPADVHWIEGIGLPNASTVGRNTLFTGGTNNFDVSLLKIVQIVERARLEFRFEAQNLLNHPQFVQVPPGML